MDNNIDKFLDANIKKEIENTELLQLLEQIRNQNEKINSCLLSQIEIKDELIDKLHQELDLYKANMEDRYINQLLKSIIKIRTDMQKRILEDAEHSFSEEDFRREYTYTFEDVTDMLEQHNIDTYQTEPGGSFNPSLHQCRIEKTSNIEWDKKVKLSISEGYRKGDKVLIPERVLVYQYIEE